MSFQVTPLPPGSAEPLAQLHQVCFPEEPWDAPALERIQGLSGAFGFYAAQSDTPVGFVLVRDLGGECEVLSLGVVPEARRRGIGSALLATVFAEAQSRGSASIVLEVAENNVAARRLYANLGFDRVGRRPRYYIRSGETFDALILRRMTRVTPRTSGT